jgi:hypothetical protein
LDVTVKTGTYCLYGLTLKSEVPLPCPRLENDQVVPDVELCECSEQELSAACNRVSKSFQDDGFWQCRIFEDETAYVHWRDHFEFVVLLKGRRVLWRKLQDVPDEVFFTYFTGHVLSYCLLLRGIEPLHATAIVVDGEAVAFLGDSGDGKSTLAASFLSKGYSLLTDDVLVLEFFEDRVLTHPSLARIKLTPESANAMFNGRRAIPMNSFTSKMIFPLQASQHIREPVRLRIVYVLPGSLSDSQIAIRRLFGRASFLPLIRNTFNNAVLNRSRIQQQFAFATRLVRMVPIKQLSYPKGLELLPRVADRILADLKM